MASSKEYTTNKRTTLSIEERVKILERLDNGEKAIKLANEYKVTKAAIRNIKKFKENLIRKRDVIIMSQGDTSKKRCTGIENTLLDKNLYKWFLEKKDMGHLVTGPMLQEKALEFNRLLNGAESFKASTGFLDKFKKRHNIILAHRVKKEHNTEKNFIDQNANDNVYPKLDNNYNEQEWKMLNDRVFLSECKTDSNHEENKEKEENNQYLNNSTSLHDIKAKNAFDEINIFISWYQTQDHCSPQDWQYLWKFWKYALNETLTNKKIK